MFENISHAGRQTDRFATTAAETEKNLTAKQYYMYVLGRKNPHVPGSMYLLLLLLP